MTNLPLADLETPATDSRARFEELAARLGRQRARPGAGTRARPGAGPALREEYWRSLRELFTRDLTNADLSRLLQHELAETFRFLTREVDTSDLAALPSWRRHPRALVRFFLAVAYRLSPWRRVLFAGSMMALVIGWLGLGLGLLADGPFTLAPLLRGHTWLLFAATLFALLLTLELRDKLSLKGDIEVARQIQFGLLPFEPWDKGGVRITTAMRPANTVGGDYFDVIELADGRLVVAVGDVAGKGMPAALLMALLQGSLRTLVSAGLRGSELMAKLNAHLCANIPSNRLITLVYAELEPATGELRYVNAGHNPPFLLSAGHPPARLGATAIALGITTDTEFDEMTLELGEGDRLVLYTDGITEAEAAGDREYGDARLGAWLQANREASGRALVDGVIAEVLEHCGHARPRDDMTLMCLERTGKPARTAAS
jgi:serine phosphatase RsbU (regulator of sigma subunit)